MTGLVASSYDQAITVNTTDAFDAVDVIIQEAMDRGDHRIITHNLSLLQGMSHIAGLAKAKLLYEARRRWEHFPVDEGYEFEDACFVEAGISRETVRKYIPIWEWVVMNPALSDEQREVIVTKPIGALDLLVAAAREGELTDEDWEEVLLSPDKASIREVVRRVRGQVGPSATAVVITKRRDCTITARRGDIHAPVGALPDHIPGLTEEQEEIRVIAQERIIRACGMQVMQ